MNRWLIWLPLVLFGLVLAVALNGLFQPASRQVTSRMVGKPVPALALPPLVAGKPGLMVAPGPGGSPRLINLFGSWCIPCAVESPQLLALKQQGVVIDAIALRDTQPAVRGFLDRYGDPFRAIGSDPHGEAQLQLGSSGVPETFVVDSQGIIRGQHIGPIGEADVPRLMAMLEQAK